MTINQTQIEQWGLYELGPPRSIRRQIPMTPFVEVRIGGQFRYKHRLGEVEGFYDGAGIYKVRFMPDSLGE
jgi:hypothetical protein